MFTAAQGKKEIVHDEVPLEENINRIAPMEGEGRSVEEAISVLRYAYCFKI